MQPIVDLRLSPSAAIADESWLTAGTIIFTADGALPVEFLFSGDRIVTRSGSRSLRALRSRLTPAGPIYRLEFDADETIYADGFEVEIPATQRA